MFSASVARVSLYDPELGQVPNFIVPIQNQTVPSQIITAQNQPVKEANNEQPNESKTQEVFYDARSGSRYIAGENGKVKLDDGIVVVSQDTRQTANIARSTLFAAPIKK